VKNTGTKKGVTIMRGNYLNCKEGPNNVSGVGLTGEKRQVGPRELKGLQQSIRTT